jgi:hypothetical protein
VGLLYTTNASVTVGSASALRVIAYRIPMKFQVVSQWGVPCRTPRCPGFAVLSQMRLKDGVKHPRPSDRGVGTCTECGCQYSIQPEQVERRLVESVANETGFGNSGS